MSQNYGGWRIYGLADYIDSFAIQMNSCRKNLVDKTVWRIK